VDLEYKINDNEELKMIAIAQVIMRAILASIRIQLKLFKAN
jgi:hypothetical protein